MIKIEVLGDVVPCARPRFSKGRVYQPTRNVAYRKRVEMAARLVMKDREPLDGEICAEVKIFRKWKRTARQSGDLDNLVKSLWDGLNGIVFRDDVQIVRCVIEKFQDKERPRAEIEVWSLETNLY